MAYLPHLPVRKLRSPRRTAPSSPKAESVDADGVELETASTLPVKEDVVEADVSADLPGQEYEAQEVVANDSISPVIETSSALTGKTPLTPKRTPSTNIEGMDEVQDVKGNEKLEG